MGISDNHPTQNSLLTSGGREYLSKSESEREELKDDTRYTKRSRIKKRIRAGMWDFGVLFSQLDSDFLTSLYDGPKMKDLHEEDHSRVRLEGHSEHAANVIAFLYLSLPYPVFKRAIEAGIFRAEKYGNDKRMITVDAKIDRVYAPTEENADAYDIDELRKKLHSGEELTELERTALANTLELFDDTREVRESEASFSDRSDS